MFNEVITIYPSYVADIEDYNNRYNLKERPLTPNPELKEILFIYDNNGHALTRITRKDRVDANETIKKTTDMKEDVKAEEPKEEIHNVNQQDDLAADYNFFDKEAIM